MGLFSIFTGTVRGPVFFYRNIIARAYRARTSPPDGSDGAMRSAAGGGDSR